jgi:hypothetical protein
VEGEAAGEGWAAAPAGEGCGQAGPPSAALGYPPGRGPTTGGCGSGVPGTGRRNATFTGMADVQAKRPALEGLVRRWVELMDRGG